MKRLVVFLSLIISASILFAQGNDENAVLTRKERRNAELEKDFQLTKSMLENKDFVLETNFLQNRYGYRFPVNSTINFVSVDSTEAIIQIGSNFRIGPNGVGGVTAKGNINRWELTEDQKHKAFTLRMNVMTTIGIYDLFINITASGRATATLTGMSSGRLTFDGDLVPWEKSSVFIGQHL